MKESNLLTEETVEVEAVWDVDRLLGRRGSGLRGG